MRASKVLVKVAQCFVFRDAPAIERREFDNTFENTRCSKIRPFPSPPLQESFCHDGFSVEP